MFSAFSNVRNLRGVVVKLLALFSSLSDET